MIGFETVFGNIRDLLRANITDVHPTRSANWIYPGLPREDATFPRIAISHIGTSRTEIGMGDQGSRIMATFEIGIWCDSQTECTINSTIYKGTRLLEYLADQVLETFVEKRGYMLTNYSFWDAELVSTVSFPYDDNSDVYKKNLNIRITWDAEKA